MKLITTKVLDNRDRNEINQLSDKEKIQIVYKEIGIENPSGHGKAKKVMAVTDDKTNCMIFMHEDHGFSNEIIEKQKCIEAISKFGDESKGGYFNMAEKKILFLSKEKHPELTKIFWYEKWQVGFKFKKVTIEGLPRVGIYQLDDAELKTEYDKIVNLYDKHGIDLIGNTCFTIVPAITNQDPFTGKNFCYASVANHLLKKDFLHLQMEGDGKFSPVRPFKPYIDHLSVINETVEIDYTLKLVGSPVIEKNCKIRIKMYFCPDLYSQAGKILHKETFTRPNDDFVGCPSVIFSFSALKKISNGYSRFDDPMQIMDSFDCRSWGVNKLVRLGEKESHSFVQKLADEKLINPNRKNLHNVKWAKPNLVLHFDIFDIDNIEDIGIDSFDVIPGLWWVTKANARNLKAQFEEEGFRNKLYSNDKFRKFVLKLDRILPENPNKYQEMTVSDEILTDKIKKEYKFFWLNNDDEIKSTDEISVKETHRIYAVNSQTNEKVKLDKNSIRFRDLSIEFKVKEIDGTSILCFSIPEHNLTLPVVKGDKKERRICTLEEYEKNRKIGYELGGPAPDHRRISVQLRHDESWNDLAKWKEVPEVGNNGGNDIPKVLSGKVKTSDIVDDSVKSDLPIFRYLPSAKKLKVNPNNKKGFALVTSEKSVSLQTKSDKIYNAALKFCRELSNDIKDATRTITQPFETDELIAEAYDNDFEWYLYDKAIQRHIQDEMNKLHDDYRQESQFDSEEKIKDKEILSENLIPSSQFWQSDDL